MQLHNIIPYIPLLAAAGSIAGLLLVAWANNKWAERPRKLDLYKLVYPEKIKAAQLLVGLAATLWEKAGRLERTGKLDDIEAMRDLRADADRLYELSIASEWIMGAHVCDLSRSLAVCIRKLAPDTPRPGGRAQWLPQEDNSVLIPFFQGYRDLTDAVRNNLHLDSLDMLLPRKQLAPEGQRTMLQTAYDDPEVKDGSVNKTYTRQ
jgi:hypothetical protein